MRSLAPGKGNQRKPQNHGAQEITDVASRLMGRESQTPPLGIQLGQAGQGRRVPHGGAHSGGQNSRQSESVAGRRPQQEVEEPQEGDGQHQYQGTPMGKKVGDYSNEKAGRRAADASHGFQQPCLHSSQAELGVQDGNQYGDGGRAQDVLNDVSPQDVSGDQPPMLGQRLLLYQHPPALRASHSFRTAQHSSVKMPVTISILLPQPAVFIRSSGQ